MKSHLIRIVVALVCFGSASALVARAAEHGLAFKDVSLGITLADFCAKYDRPFEGDPRRAPSLIFGDIFANTKPDPGRRPKRDYRSLGMVSAQKNAPFEVSKGSVPPDTIAFKPQTFTFTSLSSRSRIGIRWRNGIRKALRLPFHLLDRKLRLGERLRLK